MTRKRKFSAAQYAYLAAKAQVEVLTETFHTAMQPYEYLVIDHSNEANVKRYCEVSVDIEDQIGLPVAYDLLHEAETSLLTWGHDRVRNSPTTQAQYAARADELDALFALAINWRSYKARTGLIDITMRLNA